MELNYVDLNVLIYVSQTLVCDLEDGALRDDLLVALKKLKAISVQKHIDDLLNVENERNEK